MNELQAKRDQPAGKESPTPIWYKGREVHDWVTRFTVGDDPYWDTILLPYDVRASRAHMRALRSAGILTDDEQNALDGALDDILELHARGKITVSPGEEDCHTVIERFLIDHTGDAGRKIHTGRSRNDQVLAALRLWIRDRVQKIIELTGVAVAHLLDFADQAGHTPIPGYTHAQPAMPSTVALWSCGYAELLLTDYSLLSQAVDNINLNPLGSAAGYGIPHLHLSQEQITGELNFRSAHVAATSVQVSRGKFELQIAHALVQLASTINRLSTDCVTYASAEFGFFELPESLCTGSSIMPQKKNPDVFELARAAVHRLHAEMSVLTTLPSNLTSGYHRDLQLTKEAIMRMIIRTDDLVRALVHMTPDLRINQKAVHRAMTPELWATAAAMRLVREGVPFREAYRRVADRPDLWEAEKQAFYSSGGTSNQTDIIDGLRVELKSLTGETNTGA